jgi:hypothetical protein
MRSDHATFDVNDFMLLDSPQSACVITMDGHDVVDLSTVNS